MDADTGLRVDPSTTLDGDAHFIRFMDEESYWKWRAQHPLTTPGTGSGGGAGSGFTFCDIYVMYDTGIAGMAPIQVSHTTVYAPFDPQSYVPAAAKASGDYEISLGAHVCNIIYWD